MTRRLLSVLLILGCAESVRENVVDPANRVTVDLGIPTLVDGAIQVEWRYLAEGTGVESFRITRESGGISTDVATVAAVATTAPDWETQVYRDSTLVGGVRVLYGVVANGVDGSQTRSNQASIRVEGTRLVSAEADPDVGAIRLHWEDPPAGTTGFVILRSREGEDPEPIFSTDDATLRSFEDSNVAGNVTYTYAVTTALGSSEIQSVGIQANIYGQAVVIPPNSWFWSPRRENPIAGATQLIDYGSAHLGSRYVMLMTTDQEVEGIMVEFTLGVTNGGGGPVFAASEFLPGSVSLSAGLDAQQSFMPAYVALVAAVSGDGETALLNAYASVFVEGGNDPWTLVSSREWTADGAQRTGLASMEGDRLLFYAGTTLRLLDDSLTVVSQAVIADEPIDIEEQDGVIWLAYPDRLMKSDPVSDLTELAGWETVDIPPDITVQSISGCWGNIGILDGSRGMIHILDPSGRLMLSWEAAGTGHERGDIVCGEREGGPNLAQTDGAGLNWHFSPGGWLPPE